MMASKSADRNIAFYALVVVIVIVFAVFPFYYAIVTSFKPGRIFKINYWPESLSWELRVRAGRAATSSASIWNSVFIATTTVMSSRCSWPSPRPMRWRGCGSGGGGFC
jgi:trehalose/maltose transport system permease protein